MLPKFIFGILLLVSIATSTSVNIIMSARNLPNMDIFDGAPDPYVKVLKAEGTSDNYSNVGQTAYFDNTNSPDWAEVFNFNYTEGANQRLRFEIWDYDFDADDYMGKVEVTLSAIVNINGILEIYIEGCGVSTCGSFRIARQLNGEITLDMDKRFIEPKTVIVGI